MKAFYLLVVLLCFIVLFRFVTFENQSEFRHGEFIEVRERVRSIPRIDKGRQIFDLVIPSKGRVRVIAERFPEVEYGEVILFSGKVSQKALSNKSVVNTVYFPKIRKDKSDLLALGTGKVRSRVKETFSSYLPPSSAALLMGIVLGGKQGMSQDFVEDLQKSGVMHVVAASGMNVTFFSGILLGVFSSFFSRKKALFFSSLGVIWYAVLAGLEPSIVRASVMTTIALSAQLLGRQQSGVWALFITACLMLIFQPELLTDIGFQLSLCATAGILFIKPLLSSKKVASIPALFKEDIGSTLSAQIMTLPLILMYFHSIGMLSVIINALVLWTIPVLMIFGSIAALLGLVVPFVGGMFALLSLPFLLYFESVVKISDPFNPVFVLEEVPLPLVFGYYLVVGSVLLAISKIIRVHEVSTHR